MLSMGHIYHERQLGALCGVHCLNNLLQGPHFGPGDLAEMGVELDLEERKLFANCSSSSVHSAHRVVGASGGEEDRPSRGSRFSGHNVDPSAEGGNFSIQVLTVALQKFNLQLLPAKHPEAKEMMKDPASAARAYLCQYQEHWFAVRQIADCWWNLNSTKKNPAQVSHFYLAAWFGQLAAENYSIFLVLGDNWPEPSQPSNPPKPDEDQYHGIFELFEQAKKTGGNPLASNDEDDESSDALVARALQDQEPCDLPHQFPAVAGQSAPDVKLLRDMGFQEPLIDAALDLAYIPGSANALQLLLGTPVPAAEVVADGSRLARAIQQAVLACDTGHVTVFGQRILALVCLLCQEEASLRAAALHIDCLSFRTFIQEVVHTQVAWPPQCVSAANVALELLTNFPSDRVAHESVPETTNFRTRPEGQQDDPVMTDCRPSNCAVV